MTQESSLLLPAVQKRGYVDLKEMAWADTLSWYYGTTLPKDSTRNLPCSWAETDPATFLIRGKTYLDDHKKVPYLYINILIFRTHEMH